MPNFYEAGQDVTQVDDPVESYQRFIARVIREYESLALIFNMITVDAEQSIGEQHHQIRRAVPRGPGAAVVRLERRRGRRMAGARGRRSRPMTQTKTADARRPELIAVDGVDPAAVLAEARAGARARARAAASAGGTRPACFRSWRSPTKRRARRRRGRCCCSTPPTSRSACAGRSGRRSPKGAPSSPRRTSTPRWRSGAPPGSSRRGSTNLFRFAPRAERAAVRARARRARPRVEGRVRRVQLRSDMAGAGKARARRQIVAQTAARAAPRSIARRRRLTTT